MTALIKEITRFQVSDVPLRSFHFDIAASVIGFASLFFSKRSGVFLGLRSFAIASGLDYLIRSQIGGNPRVDTNASFCAVVLKGALTAVVEEGLYSYLLLTNQKKLIYTVARFAASFSLGMTASCSLRHVDPKTQDLVDAGVGLGWAALREVVVQKTSPFAANIFAVASNSLIFGLIERIKFAESSMRTYKMLSSMVFRLLCDFSAFNNWKESKASFIPPLTTHFFFNLSRSLNP